MVAHLPGAPAARVLHGVLGAGVLVATPAEAAVAPVPQRGGERLAVAVQLVSVEPGRGGWCGVETRSAPSFRRKQRWYIFGLFRNY